MANETANGLTVIQINSSSSLLCVVKRKKQQKLRQSKPKLIPRTPAKLGMVSEITLSKADLTPPLAQDPGPRFPHIGFARFPTTFLNDPMIIKLGAPSQSTPTLEDWTVRPAACPRTSPSICGALTNQMETMKSEKPTRRMLWLRMTKMTFSQRDMTWGQPVDSTLFSQRHSWARPTASL